VRGTGKQSKAVHGGDERVTYKSRESSMYAGATGMHRDDREPERRRVSRGASVSTAPAQSKHNASAQSLQQGPGCRNARNAAGLLCLGLKTYCTLHRVSCTKRKRETHT
jgi:hypothetical protein